MLSSKDYFLSDGRFANLQKNKEKTTDLYTKNLASTVLTNGSNTLPLNIFQQVANDIKRSFEKVVINGAEKVFSIELQKQQNIIYRNEILETYKIWKKEFIISHEMDVDLCKPLDIIKAWESLEIYMDTHYFPHSTDTARLHSAFYLSYDMHWCLLVDIITSMHIGATIYAKNALEFIFPLNIPTHQRGVSTSEEIAERLQKLYTDKETLFDDILLWYKTVSKIGDVYDMEQFTDKVSEINISSTQSHRDGFANTLGIALRTLRDVFILIEGKEINHINRRSAESFMQNEVSGARFLEMHTYD